MTGRHAARPGGAPAAGAWGLTPMWSARPSIAIAIDVAIAIAVAIVIATATTPAAAMPTFEAVRAAHRPSDLPLVDRHGTVLQRVRVDHRARRGEWLALADISPALRHALVLGEDRRFWEHGGIDWAALAAGAWSAAFDERARGASTLSMQLAALLDERLARPDGGRGVADKLAQMRAARRLEAGWRKSQILEAYLNLVPLRGEQVGVAAASLQLFGKHASGLDAVESALLAAMVRAPNAAAPLLARRACALLHSAGQACTGVEITLAQALARRPGPAHTEADAADAALAPHLARRVLAGLKIE